MWESESSKGLGEDMTGSKGRIMSFLAKELVQRIVFVNYEGLVFWF